MASRACTDYLPDSDCSYKGSTRVHLFLTGADFDVDSIPSTFTHCCPGKLSLCAGRPSEFSFAKTF